MRQRISKEEALKCSMVAFRTLVLNICVTHLQHVKEYQKNGKFDLETFDGQMQFLSAWKGKSMIFKKANAQTYRRYSTTFNYAFRFDSRLIDKLMCGYLDDDGKYHRTSVKEVVKALCDDGFLDPSRLLKRGAKFRKDGETGKYAKEYDWTNKYLLANRKQWYKLLTLEAYRNWSTYPRDKDDDEYHTFRNRAVGIMSAYYKKFKKEEAAPAKEAPKGWREVVGKFRANSIEDVIHEVETGRMGMGEFEQTMGAFRLNSKIYDEIEREAYKRIRACEQKKRGMMKLETQKVETPKAEMSVETRTKIAREAKARLERGEITEPHAVYVWRSVGVREEHIRQGLKMIREKKEAEELAKINEVANLPAKKPEPKSFGELSESEKLAIVDDVLSGMN